MGNAVKVEFHGHLGCMGGNSGHKLSTDMIAPPGGGHRFGSRCRNAAATAQNHREPEVGGESPGEGAAGYYLNPRVTAIP